MEFHVGSPINVEGLLGHVTERDGGMIEFSTPHGSTIKAGFVWFASRAKQLSEDDQSRLNDLIADARKRK